jgi:two-component system OmpR family sensor kinase
MKLIQRTNRNFLLAGLLVLPIAAFFLYFGLSYFLHSEIDEQLILDETRIVNQLKSNKAVFSVSPIIEIRKSGSNQNSVVEITDVEVYDPLEKENEPFRELKSVKKIKGEYFEITVRHSTIENEDVLLVIGVTMLLLLLFVILGLYLFNNWSSKKIWKPFYQNLETIKSFSLEDKKLPIFTESRIEEFASLKKSLTELTNKIKRDYDSLKEFTENASHEIQTPLTVISMNLEEMLQEEMSEANYRKLYSILQSTQKLSKVNEKLLLLSKLENNQFQELEEVNFTKLVSLKLEEFKVLLDENEMSVEVEIENNFCISMDPFLANLLITNLLSNAVKHNNGEKIIRIISNSDAISFENSTNLAPDLDRIFHRFHKNTTQENSIGLGLSIVKKIIDATSLALTVEFDQGMFSIILKKE